MGDGRGTVGGRDIGEVDGKRGSRETNCRTIEVSATVEF